MANTILILSANSNVGAGVVKLLQAAGAAIRCGVRNPGKSSLPNTVQADLDKPETLAAAMHGVSKVLLSTGADAGQAAQHAAAISAAKAAGAGHIVRISVVGADPRSAIGVARMHGESEKTLEASGVAFTHLRPHSFMQNLLGMAPAIAQGQLFSCTGEGKFPLVDARDISAAAAAALLNPGHEGKTYEITGPEALSHGEQAAILSRVLGRPVQYIDVPPSAVREGMVKGGLPGWLAADLTFLYENVIAKGCSANVSTHVQDILGAPGIKFETFVRDHAKAFVPAGGAGAS